MIDLLLIHGMVITMDEHRRVLQDGAVAVDKTRILEVGETETLVKKYEAKRLLDCKGNIVLPGLINCHTHAGHNLMGKVSTDSLGCWWPMVSNIYEHHSDYEFWKLDAQLSACKFLKAGVTTAFHILGGNPMSDEPELARGHVDGYCEVGGRDVVGCGIVVGEFPHRYTRLQNGKWIKKLVTIDGMAAGTEEIIRQNHKKHEGRSRVCVTQFLQLAEHGGCSDPLSLARLTALDREVCKRTREIARKYHTMINTDTYGGWVKLASMDEENALLGEDVLVGLEHQMGITPEEVGILARTGTKVYCTGEGFYKRSPLSEMLQKGITVAATTNGCAPRNMVDLLEAVRKLIFIEVTAHDDYHYLQAGKALEMITIDAAKCLGWEDEIGSLEAGKKADIAILDWYDAHLTPQTTPVQKVIYFAVGADFQTVIVDGKIVMEERKLTLVDEAAILRKAEAYHKELIQKYGLQDLCNDVTWGKIRIEFDPGHPICSRIANQEG